MEEPDDSNKKSSSSSLPSSSGDEADPLPLLALSSVGGDGAGAGSDGTAQLQTSDKAEKNSFPSKSDGAGVTCEVCACGVRCVGEVCG